MTELSKIVNPKTGRKVNVNSRIGKKLIANYTFTNFTGGGSAQLQQSGQTDKVYDIHRIKNDEVAWNSISPEGKCFFCRNSAMLELDQSCPSIKKSISDEINKILKQISSIQEGERIFVKNKDYDNAKKSLLEEIQLINKCNDLNSRLPDKDKLKIPDIPKISNTFPQINESGKHKQN